MKSSYFQVRALLRNGYPDDTEGLMRQLLWRPYNLRWARKQRAKDMGLGYFNSRRYAVAAAQRLVRHKLCASAEVLDDSGVFICGFYGSGPT